MLKLSKYEEKDFPLYKMLVFNERVMTMNLGRVLTPEEAEMLFQMAISSNAADTVAGCYKVFCRQDEQTEYIGMGAIQWNADDNVFEIEYMLLPSYWHQGYGTALVRLLLQMIQKSHAEAVIEAITDPANIYSQRILRGQGFSLVKRYINDDGEPALLYRKSV